MTNDLSLIKALKGTVEGAELHQNQDQELLTAQLFSGGEHQASLDRYKSRTKTQNHWILNELSLRHSSKFGDVHFSKTDSKIVGEFQLYMTR